MSPNQVHSPKLLILYLHRSTHKPQGLKTSWALDESNSGRSSCFNTLWSSRKCVQAWLGYHTRQSQTSTRNLVYLRSIELNKSSPSQAYENNDPNELLSKLGFHTEFSDNFVCIISTLSTKMLSLNRKRSYWMHLTTISHRFSATFRNIETRKQQEESELTLFK